MLIEWFFILTAGNGWSIQQNILSENKKFNLHLFLNLFVPDKGSYGYVILVCFLIAMDAIYYAFTCQVRVQRSDFRDVRHNVC